MGNLLAALAFRVVYVPVHAAHPEYAWRVMFFLGGAPALLSLFIRAKVKESEAWQEHRTGLDHLPTVHLAALAAFPLPRAADDDDELHVARHAGHVSDVPPAAAAVYARATRRSLTMISTVGAILGGLVFG